MGENVQTCKRLAELWKSLAELREQFEMKRWDGVFKKRKDWAKIPRLWQYIIAFILGIIFRFLFDILILTIGNLIVNKQFGLLLFEGMMISKVEMQTLEEGILCLFERTSIDISDLLATQISVSFTFISLSSILSSRSGMIYWTDKIEMTLVKPIITSFSAYTTYIFAGLLYSVIGILIFNNELTVHIGFWYSVVVMIIMTFKLIEIYFGGEKLKQILKNYYRWMSKNSIAEFEETRQKMITVMSKNMTENDFATFFENFDFLCKAESSLEGGEKKFVLFQPIYTIVKICLEHNLILAEELYVRLGGSDKECMYPEILSNAESAEKILDDMREYYAEDDKYATIKAYINKIRKEMGEHKGGEA